MTSAGRFLEGGCDCGEVRYRMDSYPMFVHCCHCRWCQRETGASFALNALVESERLFLSGDDLAVVKTPTHSGKIQKIVRCPKCSIAVWSHYEGFGDDVSFVRVGTLDFPDLIRPDVHIFTESKQPWIVLAPGIPRFKRYYSREEVWPKDSLARLSAITQTA